MAVSTLFWCNNQPYSWMHSWQSRGGYFYDDHTDYENKNNDNNNNDNDDKDNDAEDNGEDDKVNDSPWLSTLSSSPLSSAWESIWLTLILIKCVFIDRSLSLGFPVQYNKNWFPVPH